MPVIQDTIKKAIKKKGYGVLKSKERLCVLLEDLSPELEDDIGFLKKIYDNQLGVKLYDAATADEATKQQRIQDIRTKLQDDGRNKEWTDRFLQMFSQVILQTRNINGEYTIVDDEFKGDLAWQMELGAAAVAAGASAPKEANPAFGSGATQAGAGAAAGTGAALGAGAAVAGAAVTSSASSSVSDGPFPEERHKADAYASSSSNGEERRKSDSVSQTASSFEGPEERRKEVIQENRVIPPVQPKETVTPNPSSYEGEPVQNDRPADNFEGPDAGNDRTRPVPPPRPVYNDDSIYGDSAKDDQPGKLDLNRLLPLFAVLVIAAIIGVVVVMVKGSQRSGSVPVPATTTTTSETATTGNGNNGGDTTTVAQTTTTTTTTTQEEGWGSNYYDYYKGSFTGCYAYMMDVNGDDIPEMLIDKSGSYYICTQNDSGNINCLNTGDSVISYVPGGNKVMATSRVGDSVIDTVYQITGGDFESVDVYETKLNYDRYSAELTFDYEINDSYVDESSFYQKQSDLFYNAIGASSLKQASMDNLMNNRPMVTDDIDRNSFSYDFYFDGDETVRQFVAPASGRYKLTLRGGAGGADGDRVLNGSSYYDGGGATLEGTVNLSVGEKLYLVIGGPGGITQVNPCRVDGGFNGGGDTYWSGGGGGSTDLYYEGERIAAAAGGGGGQYDRNGKPGRASYSGSSNLTGSKLGGGTGHTGNDGAGAGGGGGWRGGEAGSTDMEGYGGINGYNSSYFSSTNESDGVNSPSGRDAEGYARIDFE